jgi:CRP-like cAMP-binding protein
MSHNAVGDDAGDEPVLDDRVPGLFDDCGPDARARIARLAAELAVPPGRVLLEEDTPTTRCFAIAAGQAAITRAGLRLATVGAGAIVGDRALLRATVCSATVTAVTPMNLLSFGRDELQALIELGIPGVLRQVEQTDLG